MSSNTYLSSLVLLLSITVSLSGTWNVVAYGKEIYWKKEPVLVVSPNGGELVGCTGWPEARVGHKNGKEDVNFSSSHRSCWCDNQALVLFLVHGRMYSTLISIWSWKHRGKTQYAWFGFGWVLSHKSEMASVITPATDSNSRCHCWQCSHCRLFTPSTGTELTTATSKTGQGVGIQHIIKNGTMW